MAVDVMAKSMRREDAMEERAEDVGDDKRSEG